jgi:FkbM family methyltransferase
VTLDDVVVGVGFKEAEEASDLSKLSQQVYAFEQNPFALDRVKHAVRGRRNVQLFSQGAGTKEETVRLSPPELADRPHDERSAPVQIVRLDKVQFGLSPTCLVLNCGGSELEVLMGAKGLFSSGNLRTVLLKTHQMADGRDTGPEATLWLLDQRFRTEPKKASDGSLWIIARSSRPKPQSQGRQA